jgi:hypothetical protein
MIKKWNQKLPLLFLLIRPPINPIEIEIIAQRERMDKVFRTNSICSVLNRKMSNKSGDKGIWIS